MRTREGFVVAPNMEDRGPKTFVAQDFQTTIVGMLGHDLREWLQIIRGSYALLRSRLEEMPQQAWLDRGERAATKLTEQLNCLVDAFHLARRDNEFEVSSVALEPLFWRLRHENEDAAIQRGIDLRAITADVHVTSNPVLLGCILRNLLTNAVRYTEPGGRILIGCRRKGLRNQNRCLRHGHRHSGTPIAANFRILHTPCTRNAATVWASGSRLFVVRLRCLAIGSKSDRLWVKDRFSRSTCPLQQQARAKVPR